MAEIVVKDRVKETASAPGTGTITLGGAAVGFQSFNAIGDGNDTYFAIVDTAAGTWEVNYGTYTSLGTTLTRNATPLSSSNAGALVNFTGTVDVFCTYPAEKATYEEINGNTIINGGPITILGTGVTSTPATTFGSTVGQMFSNVDSFSQLYNQNLSSGPLASSDFVAYNDQATTGEEFYVDMGINSSTFNDATTYPIFPFNSAYVYSAGVDGGTVGQNADLYVGTGTTNSDVVLFAGGLDKPNIRGIIKSADGAFVLYNGASALTTNTGEKLQVYGTAKITGATSFAAPVTTSSASTANPANNEFVTKAYVDNATSTGIHIHTPVTSETSAALSAVYTQGGTTFNITDITGTNTVVTSTTHGLSVNDEIWLTTTAGNGLSINTAYFVYATPTTTSLQLSLTYGGTLLTGLTNASGLSYATRANSGVGAYLEASANAVLPIAGVIVGDRVLVYQQSTGYWNGVYTVTSLGSVGSKWKLTRATDADTYQPDNTSGMGAGDYFFVQSNSESYVLTDPTGPIIIGYDAITYTLFSSVPIYTGTSPVNVTGTVISLSTVPATLGGTGYSSYTAGQMLYADTSTTLAKVGIGAQYQSLVSTGSAPQWSAVNLGQSAAVTGTLLETNGGTNQSTYATGDTLYASATDTLSKLSGNTSTTKKFLTQTGTGAGSAAPAWGTISGSDVNGNISGSAGSVANALTAGTYLTSGGTFDGSVARTFAVDATSANTASKVVARDGSGNFSAGTITAALSGNATTATTATNVAGGSANQIVYQSGSGASTFATAPNSSGQVLGWNGSSFAWTTTIATATSATTATNLAGGAASQIPYQTGSGATTFLANGTAGQVLTSNGSSAPSWASVTLPPISLNDITIGTSYSFPTNKNGLSVGPVTLSAGVSVTVGSGQRWVVI